MPEIDGKDIRSNNIVSITPITPLAKNDSIFEGTDVVDLPDMQPIPAPVAPEFDNAKALARKAERTL